MYTEVPPLQHGNAAQALFRVADRNGKTALRGVDPLVAPSCLAIVVLFVKINRKKNLLHEVTVFN